MAKFSTSAYVEIKTLRLGHSDTVNCVTFSPTGTYLASGGDDCALVIWNALKGSLLYRILFKSSVDVVLWHPTHPDTLIVGCSDGTLQQVQDFSLMRSEHYDIHIGARSAVHCLAYDRNSARLAIGMGEQVHITRERSPNQYGGDMLLPSPPEPEISSYDPRLRPVALQFHDDGALLIVSYLVHGICCWDTTTREARWHIRMPATKPAIGDSAISPDGRSIVVYNLVDGLDLYSLGPQKRAKAKMSYKFDQPPRTKHRLQVKFVHGGYGIICGTTSGKMHIWETKTGDLCQDLQHGHNDVIQAIGTSMHDKVSYIAAGAADRGQGTYIKIWRAKTVAEGKGNMEFGESVADLMHSVTRTDIPRSGQLVLEVLSFLLALAICLGAAWICYLMPWSNALASLTSGAIRASAVSLRIVQHLEARGHDALLELSDVLRQILLHMREWCRQVLRTFMLFLLPELADGIRPDMLGLVHPDL